MTDTPYRFWMAIAFALALFLTVTVALNLQGNFDRPQAAAAAGSTATDEIDVTLSEFSINPKEITVPAGVPVLLNVTNTGAVEHDFTIDGVAATDAIPSGQTAVLELPAMKPGSHVVRCTVAGHEAAGMTATLTAVDEAAAAPAPGEVEGHGDQAHGTLSPEEMVRLHEEGIAAFPAPTEGKGNRPLKPRVLRDGTKVFELTADEIEWETKPGVVKPGMAYNGQIPGPQLHADVGDRVRIVLGNELEEPTTLHSHGLIVPNAMDGVPGLTQPAILPGESFVYEFTVRNGGSHMYHSHFNSAEQVTKGLLGAFIVHEPRDPEVDLDYVLIANDGPLGFTLNGKDFPATQPIAARKGDLLRIRYMNEGLQIHPMHLHGIPQKVIAKDGYRLPRPHWEDTVLVGPGERIDVLVEATEVGAWALHCHILTHAEGPDGMFGMVTALIVKR